MITPRYPRFSWEATLAAGQIEITYTGTPRAIDAAGITGWGYAPHPAAPWRADVGSLHQAMGVRFTIEHGLVEVGGIYDVGQDRIRAGIYSSGSSSTLIEFETAAIAAAFGFSAVGPHPMLPHSVPDPPNPPIDMTVAWGDWQPAGIWAPLSRGGSDESWWTQPARGVFEPLSGTKVRVYPWARGIYRRVITAPTVYAADIRLDAAMDASHAQAAGRVHGDPNATLEGMLRALSEPTDGAHTMRHLRIYRAHDEFSACTMPEIPPSLSEMVRDKSARRLFEVELPLRREVDP